MNYDEFQKRFAFGKKDVVCSGFNGTGLAWIALGFVM